AIRFQVLYGFGGGGLGFQARVGFAQGSRPRSLLLLDEVVTDPAFLYGAMLLWRFVPGVQLRAEASGQIGRDGGTDSLTLLGGPGGGRWEACRPRPPNSTSSGRSGAGWSRWESTSTDQLLSKTR